jgi:hypothetical protein
LPSQQLSFLKACILCRNRLKNNLHSCSLSIYFGWKHSRLPHTCFLCVYTSRFPTHGSIAKLCTFSESIKPSIEMCWVQCLVLRLFLSFLSQHWTLNWYIFNAYVCLNHFRSTGSVGIHAR